MKPIQPTNLSRREVLATGAGGVMGGILMSGATDGAEAAPADVYRALGVKPIINAAGTITALGGSIMPPEVLAAWNAASQSFVPLVELQDRVGERIAKLLGVEAALVTTGAAGGILVGTAAALTYRDHSLVSRLPLSLEMGVEVIRQKSHRECYDNLVTACGVKLVDVETREELERAINSRTAMMYSYNVHEEDGRIKRDEWVAVARKHGIPTLLDAAADVPPVDALWKYNRMGFDLVVFSGGKALRGPQSAGLLLGRKDLIEAAKLNTSPRCGNIGRGLKVSKEEMVAMCAAVERYLKLDHDAEWREWERRIAAIADAIKDIPTVSTKTIIPPIANHVPHLLILWDEAQLKITREQLKQRLAEGDTPIMTGRVHGTGDEGFLISVFMLQPGEEKTVAQRIRQVLGRSS
ncbi:MAG: aminotransferase class V-fold PLP-dependent enzyme [Planctomycetaceae bacterium]|nr:aminotransferase class V-fold PLP-dependent enzyme [Planctomycetaceae bacterium]